MRADNSRHIIAAARQRRELTRAKAIQALRTLDNDGAPVTFETVAHAADVSRSWLYAQPDIRAEIERLRAAGRRAPTTPIPSRQRSSDSSLLKRLVATETAGSRAPAQPQALRRKRRAASTTRRSPRQLRAANTHPNATVGRNITAR